MVQETRPKELPDKEAVIRILDQLRRLVFPEQDPDLWSKTSALLVDTFYRLKEQFRIALGLRAGAAETTEKACKEGSALGPRAGAAEDLSACAIAAGNSTDEAERLAFEFLQKIPHIRELLSGDVQAEFDGDPAATSTGEVVLCYPGLYAISVYRIAHELYLMKIPLLPRIMSEHAHSLTGIDIHPGATIGHHFFIDHGTGIVVGETAHIGDYVKLYQGVTIGALSTREGQHLRGVRRHPTIGDRVTIYSGASILGGETVIGDDAVIGGNCFITTSVPAGTVVSIRNHEIQRIKTDRVKSEYEGEEGFYVI
ncbi:MAG: serine acetyltransferase [Deltaproteobacteria bacterium]|nr:serine acetyltransferase [Deltaproteobacteria bacterium]MBR4209871.1 serine acetyltransferase [Lachnospiraceae bacterium]